MHKSTIERALEKYESDLTNSKNRKAPELTRAWTKKLSDKAGIYGWFEDDELIYVGETGKISDRINDCRFTQRHTLRRSLGADKFANWKGYERATSRKRFSDRIEKALEKEMSKLKLSVLRVPFGRTELEEYLIEKYEPKYNQKTRRGS